MKHVRAAVLQATKQKDNPFFKLALDFGLPNLQLNLPQSH